MNTVDIDGKLYKLTEIKPEKKDHILFTFTMPRFNTWNNRWTGEGRKYTRSCRGFRYGKKIYKKLKEGNFQYDFGDGWVANVNVKFVTKSEAKEADMKSEGFCGYEWMIDQLKETGDIVRR